MDYPHPHFMFIFVYELIMWGLGLGLTCSNMLIAVRDSNKRNMNYEASQIKFRKNEALSITKSEYISRSKVTVLY